ncbi:aldehyde reductase II [Aspergillus sclerotioniger CBS 115572]|uniref:Aldehyde reductase II n=1 Tax=Aspergillus sclerotioniger CBS 115572 TaxID=1450535 RepID=A0A317WZG7_9EURO|nr:aldehyde reductase II [Aspergillus sclerotioniger CBS 115572]PWY89620.1 aldehyde reductase II [Aspergillus sclerotioniger CBS 115572]
MTTSSYSLPLGSWILVTGANGYIASQVIDAFLTKGYRVRGTVRSEKPWMDEYFQATYGPGNFETVIVPDLEADGALDGVVQDVGGIVHVASDMSYRSDPNIVISGVAAQTMNVLSIAERVSSIKRVVLCSSVTTAFPAIDDAVGLEDKTVTQNTWNEPSIAAAWDPNTPEYLKPNVVYTAAKIEAERGAWKWYEEHKPDFVLNSVLPNINFGKILFPEHQGSSMKVTSWFLDGNDLMISLAAAQYYVDVEDTARLHVIATLDPNVKSERVFACAGPFKWDDVVQILRNLQPQSSAIVNASKDTVKEKFDIVPSARAEQLLRDFYGRSGWTSLEDSVKRGLASLGV